MANKQFIYLLMQQLGVLAVAMLLMIWGTMNFVTNWMDFGQGPEGRDWKIGLLFAAVFSALPFFAGAWVASRVLKRKKAVSETAVK